MGLLWFSYWEHDKHGKIISIIKFSQLFAPSNEKIAVLMTLQSSLGLLLHVLWTYHISSFVSIVLSYPSNVCTRICVHACVWMYVCICTLQISHIHLRKMWNSWVSMLSIYEFSRPVGVPVCRLAISLGESFD